MVMCDSVVIAIGEAVEKGVTLKLKGVDVRA